MPLISIITIVKNDREGLRRTLASVACQSFTDYEHIVIDGGSVDGGVAVIHAHAGRLSHWISEPDGGIADAFNKGLRLASGQWLNFLNAGDCFVDADVLARVVPHLPEAAIVTGQTTTDGTVSPPFPATNRHRLPRRAWISHQASFIHRRVFDSCGEFDTRFGICMDYEFWLRSLTSHRLHFIESVLVDFAPGGISTRDRKRWLDELYLANRLHLPDARWVNLRIALRVRLHTVLCRLGGFAVYRRLRHGLECRTTLFSHEGAQE